MTLTLDRTREAGTIHGDNDQHPGAFYEQDGFFFDNAGNLLEDLVTDAARARLDERLRRDAAIEDARARFMEATGMDAEAASKVISAENLTVVADAEVDLAAWAKGEKKYPFDRITAEIRARFNVGVTNKRQALEVLAENGLAAPVAGDRTIS